MNRRHRSVLAALVLLALVPSGAIASGASYTLDCPIALPQGAEPVALGPEDFVVEIDNPYWPMPVGARWVYRETSDGLAAKVLVRVKARTKLVNGVTATVVHDRVSQRGELIEDTFDWYAQDTCGNVWYLGENTKEYEDGRVVSTEGSWEWGVDGALPGVVMPADPVPGLRYRQEYLEGEAEDAGTVMSLEEQVEVPAGHFRDVVMTRDFTPLERRILEYKFYARGIGPVMAITVSGGTDREVLVSYEIP